MNMTYDPANGQYLFAFAAFGMNVYSLVPSTDTADEWEVYRKPADDDVDESDAYLGTLYKEGTVWFAIDAIFTVTADDRRYSGQHHEPRLVTLPVS